MRILHVVATGSRRGAEMFTADLAGALADTGVTQRVAVLERGGPMEAPFPVQADIVETNGRVLPGLRVRSGTVLALRRLIRGWKPGLIQVHGGQALKYAVLATRWRGPPIVYRRIGSATYGNDRGVRRVGHVRLMRQAACVVAVAEAVRRETIEVFRLRENSVVTIPNAVDSARLRPSVGRDDLRRMLGIDQRVPLVLSLGALTWEKDPLAHLAVAERVLRSRHDLVHLIVGEGPLRESVEEQIGRLGLGGSVRTLPPRADVPDLFAASDLLLLASRTEGMPGVVIEAGMMGVPVVAFDVAGVPEIVDEGVTGYLAPPGDVDTLSARVLHLVSHRDLREAMGEAARRRCREFFDIRAVAPRYLELYERLVSRAPLHTTQEPS